MRAKRRATQAVLQKVGKVQKEDDSELVKRKDELLLMQPKLTAFLRHAEQYIRCARGALLHNDTLFHPPPPPPLARVMCTPSS